MWGLGFTLLSLGLFLVGWLLGNFHGRWAALEDAERDPETRRLVLQRLARAEGARIVGPP